MDICSSPKLIAAYHVFHRLLVPRHPPCALFCLASSDAIALTSDGLLVFFLSLLSQCLVFVSILRLTYHQEMNVLHMRFSRYSFHMPAFNIQAGILCGKTNIFSFTASGDKEIRTLDPLLARQVLSQLSYIPFLIWRPPALPHRLQCSTIGRSGLNRRVRDGYGCFP